MLTDCNSETRSETERLKLKDQVANRLFEGDYNSDTNSEARFLVDYSCETR